MTFLTRRGKRPRPVPGPRTPSTHVTEADSRTRAADPSRPGSVPSREELAALTVADLRALALSLGIGPVSTLRKGSLVDAISDTTATDQSGTDAPGVDPVDRPDATDGTRPEDAPLGEVPAR